MKDFNIDYFLFILHSDQVSVGVIVLESSFPEGIFLLCLH